MSSAYQCDRCGEFIKEPEWARYFKFDNESITLKIRAEKGITGSADICTKCMNVLIEKMIKEYKNGM